MLRITIKFFLNTSEWKQSPESYNLLEKKKHLHGKIQFIYLYILERNCVEHLV